MNNFRGRDTDSVLVNEDAPLLNNRNKPALILGFVILGVSAFFMLALWGYLWRLGSWASGWLP